MSLSAAALAQPLWDNDIAALRSTADAVLREPSVCTITLSDASGNAPVLHAQRCSATQPVTQRRVEVRHADRPAGVLSLAFDDGEVERLVAARRNAVLKQVILQVAFGVAVLLGVLSLRLLRPIDQLKSIASAIAARSAPLPLVWKRRDELGELAQHLNGVRARIDELFDELERKNAQLRKMAMYDHLTGLPNRTLMRELFQHEAAAARRQQRALALLFIDLDRFKDVNDTLGHSAGDELLLGTSQRLLHTLRQSDLVCRVSGDEFVVLLREAESPEQVMATAERLLHAIETPLPLLQPVGDGAATREAQVSASVGVALYPRDADDFDTLLRRADLAMYEAKQQGRGRVAQYRAELDQQLLGRVELERELQQAIGRGELLLHYQPVVDARSGAVTGCEALVRWQHPTRGLLMPVHFIEVAEASGLIREVGAWTIEAACAQLRQWKRDGHAPARVAVNVSAHQFRDQRLIDALQRACERHGIHPGELELELTESTLMADVDAARRACAALRAIGVSLVIDDFGTGYSSLAYLKQLKPDKLKIDRSFVRDLPGDPDDRALTQAILRMAQALYLNVVAEGVETEEQRRFLQDNGCPLLQGFLLGRPMAAVAFAAALAAAANASGAAAAAAALAAPPSPLHEGAPV
jgi:diguanylate cyclase (GGDEF)-like protein